MIEPIKPRDLEIISIGDGLFKTYSEEEFLYKEVIHVREVLPETPSKDAAEVANKYLNETWICDFPEMGSASRTLCTQSHVSGQLIGEARRTRDIFKFMVDFREENNRYPTPNEIEKRFLK